MHGHHRNGRSFGRAARWTAMLACAGAPLLLAACSSSPGVKTPDGLLGAERAPSGALKAEHVYAHPGSEPVETRLRVVSGSIEGETILRELRPLDVRKWLVIERRERGDEQLTEDTLRLEDDGSVVLVSSIDYGERVLTTFDPPLLLMPASLEPGNTHTQSLRVRIHPQNNPDRVRDQGDATHELTYKAVQAVDLASGPVEGRCLHSSLSIGLRAARVRSETRLWTRPETDEGADRLIARESDEQARAFGILVRSMSRLVVVED